MSEPPDHAQTHDYDTPPKAGTDVPSLSGVSLTEGEQSQVVQNIRTRPTQDHLSSLSDTHQSFLSGVSSVSIGFTTLWSSIESRGGETSGSTLQDTNDNVSYEDDMFSEENIYEDPETFAREV